MNFDFICPVCMDSLKKTDGTMKCENGHCFDIAKQGYVNLLQSQKSSAKRHGDDKLMVKSRSDFLNKGYYDILARKISERVGELICDDMRLADLGCGECYYTAAIADDYPEIVIGGIDISKYALIGGSRRNKSISLAVASTFDLPIADGYCDCVMSVFAPYSIDEIKRVLKSDGKFIRAYPLEKHLMGLKSVIYDKPYLNDVDRSVPDGFELMCRDEIGDVISLDNNSDIEALFEMTPYYYKTGSKDQSKVRSLSSLKTEIQFGLDVYRKL
ncbi:MAG TPA: methyltransferase [Ruminococcaceae bacterium]|nr:methyltransferase [Oscillospiraceae bacterium]